MPYLKADDSRAIAIHEEYQLTNDSKTFLKDTREFLASKAAGGGGSGQQQQQQQTSSSPMPPAVTSASASPSSAMLPLGATTPVHASSHTPIQSPIRQPVGHPIQSLSATPNSHMSPAATSQNSGGQYHHHQQQHSNHPLVPLTAPPQSSPIPQANLSSFQLPSVLHHQQQQQQHNSMPPPPPPPTPQQQQGIISRLPAPLGFPVNVQQQQQQQQQERKRPLGIKMARVHAQQGKQKLF